jgi:hypothetical protein
MIEIEFSSEEIAQVHYEGRYHPHPRVRQRMETLYLKALGYQHQEIGRIVGIGQKAAAVLHADIAGRWHCSVEGIEVLSPEE